MIAKLSAVHDIDLVDATEPRRDFRFDTTVGVKPVRCNNHRAEQAFQKRSSVDIVHGRMSFDTSVRQPVTIIAIPITRIFSAKGSGTVVVELTSAPPPADSPK
jgi:hypothetical protein